MHGPAGIIGRIRAGGEGEPAAVSEYLRYLDGDDRWTAKRIEALHFESYEKAAELALAIGHCFGLVVATRAQAKAAEQMRPNNSHVGVSPELTSIGGLLCGERRPRAGVTAGETAPQNVEPVAPAAVAILAQEAIKTRKQRQPKRDRRQLLKALNEKPTDANPGKFWWRTGAYA